MAAGTSCFVPVEIQFEPRGHAGVDENLMLHCCVLVIAIRGFDEELVDTVSRRAPRGLDRHNSRRSFC